MSDGPTEGKVNKPKYKPTGNLSNLTGMGKGRPKGVPNVINRDIKEMILGALSDVGGRAYLARQAERNPNAFMGLIGRVLPLSLAGHDGGKLTIAWDMSGFGTPAIASPGVPTIEGNVRDAEVVLEARVAHPEVGEAE